MKRIRIDWEFKTEWLTWEARVPATDSFGSGHYHIWMEPRPRYCDRGRWKVCVDSHGVVGLDGQEGFPRYYFDLDRAKVEMEEWVNAREACRKAMG